MTENNKFINKFELKSKSELEYYIENPSQFNPLAVKAAEFILENKDFDNQNKEIQNKQNIDIPKNEFEFKEKAFFKNKWVYRIALTWMFIYFLLFLFVLIYNFSTYSLIMTLIFGASFYVIISKHKRSITYLKQLGYCALLIHGIQYLIYFSLYYDSSTDLNIFSVFKKDLKLILLCLLMIITGSKLIETRMTKVKSNKT